MIQRGLGFVIGYWRDLYFYFVFLYHVLQAVFTWMMYVKVFCVEKRIIFNQKGILFNRTVYK